MGILQLDNITTMRLFFFSGKMSSTSTKSSKMRNKKKEHGRNNLFKLCGIESGAKAESVFRNFF